jgi:YHS domain-containing protein
MKPFNKTSEGLFICECENCTFTAKIINVLSKHISKVHNISKQEYFDKYIFEEGDDVCKANDCINKTKFDNLREGYKNNCCKECSKKSNYQHIKDNCLKKHGVEYYFQSDEYKEKFKKICQEKWGVDNPFQAEEVKEQIKETCLERYGVEIIVQSKEFKEKAKITKKERYDDENYRNDEKIKQTCLERYGVEYASQSNKIKEKKKQTIEKLKEKDPDYENKKTEKSKQTCLEHFGVEYYSQSEECKEHMELLGIWKSPEEKSEYENYRSSVCRFTNQSLSKFYHLIPNFHLLNENKNIENFKDKWSIDHRFSIFEGFKNNISPEIIGSIINLQVITVSDNASKNAGCSIKMDDLIYEYTNFISITSQTT